MMKSLKVNFNNYKKFEKNTYIQLKIMLETLIFLKKSFCSNYIYEI